MMEKIISKIQNCKNIRIFQLIGLAITVSIFIGLLLGSVVSIVGKDGKVLTDSLTVTSTGVMEVASGSKIEEGPVVKDLFGKEHEIFNVPLFSLEEDMVQLGTNSVIYVLGDDEPIGLALESSSFLEKNGSDIRVSNINTITNEGLDFNYSELIDENNDGLISYSSQEHFLIIPSKLIIDGDTEYELQEFTHVNFISKAVEVYALENEDLVKHVYEYDEDAYIEYGNLEIKENQIKTDHGTINITDDNIPIVEEPEEIEEIVIENEPPKEGQSALGQGGGTAGSGEEGGVPQPFDPPKTERPKPPVYQPPVFSDIHIINDVISPYNNINISIQVDNPDEYNIILINTEQMSFAVNSTVDGELILSFPPSLPGLYELDFNDVLVSKTKTEIIELDANLTFEVLEHPYLSTGTFDSKDKRDSTTNLIVNFDNTAPIIVDGNPNTRLNPPVVTNFVLNTVYIEGVAYSDIDKISDEQFRINNVDIDIDTPGNYRKSIDKFDYLVDNKAYQSNVLVHNAFDGYVLKDEFDPQNVTYDTTVIGTSLEVSYNAIDPDLSINSVKATVFNDSTNAIINARTSRTSANGEYKILFRNAPRGTDLRVEIEVEYGRDLINTKVVNYTIGNLANIPFTPPEIVNISPTYPFTINEEKFDVYFEVSNPDSFILTEIHFNNQIVSSANIVKMSDELFVAKDVRFLETGDRVRLEEFVITSIVFIDPNNEVATFDPNVSIKVAYLNEPYVYTDSNNNLVVNFMFLDDISENDIILSTAFLDEDDEEIVFSNELEPGLNSFVLDYQITTSEILDIEFKLTTDATTENFKIDVENSYYALINTTNEKVTNNNQTFLLQENGSIKHEGLDVNDSSIVPKGEFEKIVFSHNIGVAYDYDTYSATAWGFNADDINYELDKYASRVIDVAIADVDDNEYLIGLILDDLSYVLIGSDNDGRITNAPQCDATKLILTKSSVSCIDSYGVAILGGTDDGGHATMLSSFPIKYQNGSIQLGDLHIVENAIAIQEMSGFTALYAFGPNLPSYDGINKNITKIDLIAPTSENYTTLAVLNEVGEVEIFTTGDNDINDTPDYVENTTLKVKNFTFSHNNILLDYEDDSYIQYGSNEFEQNKINKIFHIPTVDNITLNSVVGDFLIPSEEGLLQFDVVDNFDGLYLTEVSIEDKNGVVKSFENNAKHEYNAVDFKNVLLDAKVGANIYKIVGYKVQNRFVEEEIKTVKLKNPVQFLVEFSEGLRVAGVSGTDVKVIYAVLNPKLKINLYSRPASSSTWDFEKILDSNSNQDIVDNTNRPSIYQYKIEAVEGAAIRETYISNDLFLPLKEKSYASTHDTYTIYDQTDNLHIKGSAQNPITHKVPEIIEPIIKVDTMSTMGAALTYSGNLHLWGDDKVDYLIEMIEPFQGRIADFQLFGLDGDLTNEHMINVVLEDGSNHFLIEDESYIKWDLELLRTKNIATMTGNQDIVYYIESTGDFAVLFSNSDRGKHTRDRIPTDILNGTTKISQIEFSTHATYFITDQGKLEVARRDQYSKDQACFINEKGKTVTDFSLAGFGFNTSQLGYKNERETYVRAIIDGQETVCIQTGSNTLETNPPKYEFIDAPLVVDANTEKKMLADGIAYINDTSYYFLGNNEYHQSNVNYLPYINSIDVEPGNTYASIEIFVNNVINFDAFRVVNEITGQEINIHKISDEKLFLLDLIKNTDYEINLYATIEDLNGQALEVKLNQNPIVFTTLDIAPLQKPSLESVTHKEVKNHIYEVTALVNNPSQHEYELLPKITNGTITLINTSVLGPLDVFVYQVENNKTKVSELNFKLNMYVDRTKHWDQYATSIEEFYQEYVRGEENTYSGKKDMVNSGVLMYKSPNYQNRWYPMVNKSYSSRILGIEAGLPNSYIYDDNGEYVDDWAFSNPYSSIYEKLFTQLDFGKPSTATTFGLGNSYDYRNGNFGHTLHKFGYVDSDPGYFYRWNVDDVFQFSLIGFHEMPDGNYAWDLALKDPISGVDLNLATDLVYVKENDSSNGTSFSFNEYENGINQFETPVYFMPNTDWEVEVDTFDTLFLGPTNIEMRYSYADRVEVVIEPPSVDSFNNELKFYINEGVGNLDLQTASLVCSKTLSAKVLVQSCQFDVPDIHQDYTFFVTYDTKRVSNVLLDSVSFNSHKDEPKFSTWNAITNEVYLYVLMPDGTIVSNDPIKQAQFDAFEYLGVEFESVNTIIKDTAGVYYCPYTLAPVTDVKAFYTSGIRLNKSGTYIFDYNDGSKIANRDNMSLRIVQQLNRYKSSDVQAITFGLRFSGAALNNRYDVVFGNYWNELKPVRNYKVLSFNLHHNSWTRGPITTDYVVQGETMKRTGGSVIVNKIFGLTVENKLVATHQGEFPDWVPRTNISHVQEHQYDVWDTHIVQHDDGTIYAWERNTLVPIEHLNGLNTSTGETSIGSLEASLTSLANKFNQFKRNFSIGYGMYDPRDEVNLISLLDTYNNSMVANLLPFTRTVDDITMDIHKMSYNDFKKVVEMDYFYSIQPEPDLSEDYLKKINESLESSEKINEVYDEYIKTINDVDYDSSWITDETIKIDPNEAEGLFDYINNMLK